MGSLGWWIWFWMCWIWVNETLCFVVWQTGSRVICVSNLEAIVQDSGDRWLYEEKRIRKNWDITKLLTPDDIYRVRIKPRARWAEGVVREDAVLPSAVTVVLGPGGKALWSGAVLLWRGMWDASEAEGKQSQNNAEGFENRGEWKDNRSVVRTNKFYNEELDW